jgi:putative transposase
MARTPRNATGDLVYHVLNRANGRMQIFKKESDYQAFRELLSEAKGKYPMRILSYCLMPNHWHLLLYPKGDADLPRFMRWLGLTHTQRWHAAHKTTGYGHLYQGRYKSFPVQTDEHFLQVTRYIERNPLRAKLVSKVQEWPWSSLWLRTNGTKKQRSLLDLWPVPAGRNYVAWVNQPQPKEEVETIRYAIKRGRPYGAEEWIYKTAKELNLEPTLNPRGRPRTG